MRVKNLNINNLRNIRSTQIELDSCLNCFIGDNGAGKTSVLEALAVLSKGRSFRSGQISSLIGPETDCFQIVSKIESQSGETHQLGMERGADYWIARHSGEDVQQISKLTRLLPYVLLEPSSHTLVSGPPDVRRKYLDWGVFHVEHGFLALWRKYKRVLKQRNAALRQSNKRIVGSLDPQFLDLGEQLHQARKHNYLLLNNILMEKLPVFSDSLKNINLTYRKGWTGENLGEAIKASLSRDLERGSTGPGPHRADLHLTLDGSPAKELISRGEQKAMTAAMIIAQAKMICDSGEKPVLMLDDLFSEFDETHLVSVLRQGINLDVQIWLTGTGTTSAMSAFERPYTRFHVEHGEISGQVMA
jgi:DNA replication and repair protein RecF